MRILFVTPQVPHPTQGGAAMRNWHLMRAATEAGHTVHLITPEIFQDDPDASPQPLTLPPYRHTHTRRMRDLVLSRIPDLAHRLGVERLRLEIARRCADGAYDLIQVEGLEMWPSVPTIGMPVVYDAHNAEATLQQRMGAQAWRDHRLIHAAYSLLQARKLRRYEAAVMHRVICTLAVSDADAAHLHRLAPTATVHVVPIGVDTAYYAPDATDESVPCVDVVFTGTFGYRANDDAADWFLHHVWPLVRQSQPKARCAIVGRQPGAHLRAFDGRDGISVTGAVPDDRPFMAAAMVYMLPIRFGAGVRVKFLNAMSMGCAIVATPAACEGIDVTDGQEVVVAPPEPTAFAAAILALLADPQRCAVLGVAARVLACQRYDWSVCTPSLLKIYDELAHENG